MAFFLPRKIENTFVASVLLIILLLGGGIVETSSTESLVRVVRAIPSIAHHQLSAAFRARLGHQLDFRHVTEDPSELVPGTSHGRTNQLVWIHAETQEVYSRPSIFAKVLEIRGGSR